MVQFEILAPLALAVRLCNHRAMPKKLIITEKGASTIGKCPHCGQEFTVSPMPNDTDYQRKKLEGIYAAHLKEKGCGEDVNQAAARIVREATES